MPTDKLTPGNKSDSRKSKQSNQKEVTTLDKKYQRVCDELRKREDDLRKSIQIRQKLVDKLQIYKDAHDKIKQETTRFSKEMQQWRAIQQRWDEIQMHVEQLERQNEELRRSQSNNLNFKRIWSHIDVLSDEECDQLHSRLVERLNYPKSKSKSNRVKKSRRATTTQKIPPRQKESPLPKRHSFPLKLQSRSRGEAMTNKAVLNNAPLAPRHPTSRSDNSFAENYERFRSDTTQAEAVGPVSKLSPFTQEL